MDYHYKYLKYRHKYKNLLKNHNNEQKYFSRLQNLRESNHIIINRLSGGSHQDQNRNVDVEEYSYDTKAIGNISNAINNMAINIFENFDGISNIFSPVGIAFTMALIQLATAGNTDTQLLKFLNHKYGLDELKFINQIFNNNIMKMKTIMIINDKYKINKEYVDMVKSLVTIIYDNFDKLDLIINKVNKKIERDTNGMIKNVISSSDINVQSLLILINTIYYKASWQYKFDVNNTKKMVFHKTQNDMVDMMHQVNRFNYFENNSLQMIELPYSEQNCVMGIILPKKYLEADNLDYSVNNVPILSENEISEIINNTQYKLIDLYLPKFTHRKNIDFVSVMKKMGVIDLFDPKRADLDIIMEELYISKIIHEAVVIVDEIGTEAAAATVAIATKRAIISGPSEQPILFKADHAFTYYIRHVPTNIFLFYGDYQGHDSF